MTDNLDVDIAIVGGGIAGPALACALRGRGDRIVLIEAQAGPLDTARGDHLQPVACDILEQWGALDAFWARGAEKRLGAKWRTAEGDLLLDGAIDGLPIAHPFYLYLNHERICDVLLDLAQENTAFTLLRPARAALSEPDGDRFGLRVSREGQPDIEVRAGLVVAADGRASALRQAAGIKAEIHQYQSPLVVLFADRTFDDPRNELHAFVGEEAIVSVVPRTGQGWKIGIPIARDEIGRWKRAGDAERSALFGDLVPALGAISTRLADFYPTAMVRVEAWQRRNLVLVGDACHAMHPGRSQGMNTAIRCIAALIDHLPAPDRMRDPNAVHAVLTAFERTVRPGIDARLDDNHQRGLDMDLRDPAQNRALMDQLRAVQANPDTLFRYRMDTTGCAMPAAANTETAT